MKFFKQTITLLVFALAIVPFTASASAVINRGGRSMCKQPADIQVHTSSMKFEGKSSLSMSSSGSFNIRALAANTGDTPKDVSYSISQSNPGTPATSHTFTVVIDGVTHSVQLTTPSPSTVVLDSSYKVMRDGIDNPDFVLTSIPDTTQQTYYVTESGLGFGNNYVQYPCNQTINGSYLYGGFLYNVDPVNDNFEVGLQNVYNVVLNANPPINTTNCPINLDANPTFVPFGNNMVTALTWYPTITNSCTQPTSCTGTWTQASLSPSGNQTGVPVTVGVGSTQTYTITCEYPNKATSSDSASVTVGNPQQNNNYCPPTLDATPNIVAPGGNINLYWNANSASYSCIPANYCFADDAYGWGNGQLSNQGNRNYNAPQSLSGGQLNFRIKCYYPDSSIRTANDYVTVQGQYVPPPPPPPNPPPVIIPVNYYTNPGNSGTNGIAGSPIVRTLSAKSIEKKSAKLRGYFNANGCPAITTWFEYSTDKSNLDLRSDSITQTNKYGNVEFVAVNLRPATKYYYRIVGENCKGLSLGAIESFRTASGSVYTSGGNVGSTTQTTTVKNTTVIKDTSIKTVGAGTSYLRLDVTNDNDIPDETNALLHTVIRGEVIVYRVVWENLTTSMLHDGKIRVNLPRALTYMNSSNGLYDKDSHSIYMTIGDIAGRASGVEFITVQVTTSGQIGDPVIVEANAAFDAPGSDAQVNATDFDEDVLGDRNVAAASTPFFGNWMWFIGLGLLLILVFLIARYHTLASQYRGNGGYAGGYQPNYQPVYTPPPAPVAMTPKALDNDVDPFVPPQKSESNPVYKPYNPNS